MNKNKNKWSWWKTLLWAYSILYILFWTIIFFAVPYLSGNNSSPANPAATTTMSVMFIPVLIFLVLEGIENL